MSNQAETYASCFWDKEVLPVVIQKIMSENNVNRYIKRLTSGPPNIMINIIEDSQVISYDEYEWIENDSVVMFEGFFHQAMSCKRTFYS